MKVVFACPTVNRPYDAFLKAMEDSVPCLDAAGIDHKIVWSINNAYISAARASMLRQVMDAQADAVVFLDHDLSWDPPDILKLIQTHGGVVAGTYRFKTDEEEYMGTIHSGTDGRPLLRLPDRCIKASRIPAGFLKVTKEAVGRFMENYPNLVYGPPWNPSVDLFNHGAHKGLWYGEDYAFARNCCDANIDIWIVPNLNIDHHHVDPATKEHKVFPGNFHKFLLRQPQPEALAA